MQRLQKREGWLAVYVDPLLMRQAEEIQPLAIPAKQYFKSRGVGEMSSHKRSLYLKPKKGQAEKSDLVWGI